MTQKIAILGCGHLGAALVGGFCANLGCSPSQILISDLNAEKIAALSKKFGVTICADARTAAGAADVSILAVKPGAVLDLLRSLSGILTSDKMLISVAAGVNLSVMHEAANPARLVRVMPNLASVYGVGVSAIYAEQRADALTAEKLFKCVGTTLLLQREEQIDAATALGGSGPAFVFYAVEGLIAGALKMGLSAEQAAEMAGQMVLGAGTVLSASGKTAASLREMVATPGGCTIEGIKALEQAAVGKAMSEAIEAAVNKLRVKN